VSPAAGSRVLAHEDVSAFAYDGPFRIGSLAFRLRAADAQDSEAISLMFKQPLDGSGREPDRADPGLIDIVHGGPGDYPEVPADGLVVSRSHGRLTICSELMTASLEQRAGSWRARIAVRDRGCTGLVYRVHLSIVLHRILLALERAYLHAAAVTLRGRTFVFVGEKGAGKSSIALSLGRAGATILSDDHVLLRLGTPRYFVSGCEAYARVTAETEAAVFARPLAVEAADFAGTLKKEFIVSDFFESLPHKEAPVAAILFPHIGERLALTPWTGAAAALDLIDRKRRSYRPQDAEDVQALLDFWSGFALAAPAFKLQLTPNLGDLGRLPDLLDACVLRS
jgi:hypothetical protein